MFDVCGGLDRVAVVVLAWACGGVCLFLIGYEFFFFFFFSFWVSDARGGCGGVMVAWAHGGA